MALADHHGVASTASMMIAVTAPTPTRSAGVGETSSPCTGGATAANVSLSSPITGTGAVSFAPGAAALVVSGAGSKVTVGK